VGVEDIVQCLSHLEVVVQTMVVVVVPIAEAVVAAAVVVLVAEAVVAAAVDMKAEVVNLRFFYLYCH
jgi:hypothetical protein